MNGDYLLKKTMITFHTPTSHTEVLGLDTHFEEAIWSVARGCVVMLLSGNIYVQLENKNHMILNFAYNFLGSIDKTISMHDEFAIPQCKLFSVF